MSECLSRGLTSTPHINKSFRRRVFPSVVSEMIYYVSSGPNTLLTSLDSFQAIDCTSIDN